MQRLVLLLVLCGAPAVAQTVHIGSISGSVSLRQGSGAAVPAAADTLAISDTTIITGAHSTAQVDFDWARQAEVNPNSEFRLVLLGPGVYQTEIVRGGLTWWVRGYAAARVEVKTPSVTAIPHEPGTYQVVLTAGGESEVTAWEGAMEVAAPGGAEWVNAGQKMIARGSPADPEFRIVGAISRWRKALAVIANGIQITSAISDILSSGDGGRAPTKAAMPSHQPPGPAPHAPQPPSHSAPGPPGHGSPGHSSGGDHGSAGSASHSAPAAPAAAAKGK